MAAEREVVLVTGSSGRIGTALVERLVRRFRVVGLDLDEPRHLPRGAGFVELDVSSDDGVRAALARVRGGHGDRIASVVHLAAFYDFSGEPSDRYDEVTVRGTGRLLHQLHGFRVEQFVFSSTMLVHAPGVPGQKIDEDWLLEPKWDYPRSKVATEQLLRERHGCIPLVLLRIAGVYDDGCHSIPLAQQIRRIHGREITSTVFPGDPTRGQAFLHLDDLVDAIDLVVQKRGRLPAETTLLLGEPETVSYDELQRAFGRLIHGEEWTTKQIPKALAKTGAWLQGALPFVDDPFIKPWMVDLADDHYELDIGRARAALGWQPRRSLRDTLPVMVARLKADPAGWYAEHRLEPPEGVPRPAAAGADGRPE